MKLNSLLFAAIIGLVGINAYADTVELSTMFDIHKENEYAFSQKYENKRLQFDAVIHAIDSKCYTRFLNWDGDTENVPCAKLDAPDTTIELWGLEVPIANAIMKDNDDLLKLKRGQHTTLECELTSEYLFDLESFTFKDCIIVE